MIEGFDVEDGLARTLGNREFYLQMLARFRDGQRDAAEKIHRALEGNERLSAERLAHTLKGVAGQLGAVAMQELAGRLEAEIHGGAEATSLIPLLDRVEADMRALRSALAHVLPGPEPVVDSSTLVNGGIDREAAQDLIRRFAGLLRECDGEAIDLLSESGALLTDVLGSDTHKQIARAARQFDFDAALAALVKGAQAADYRI